MTDTLHPEQWLRPEEMLVSSNKFHTFVMQGDGNLVLNSLNRPVWASGTHGHNGASVVLQGDGNLVIMSPSGKPIWASGSHGHEGSRLVMQNDRNAVIYNQQNQPTWASTTDTDPTFWETREIEMSHEFRNALQNDPTMATMLEFGVACSVPGPHVSICVGAVIVIAAFLEFKEGKPPIGPNNDLRVMGGQISKSAKKAGKELSDWSKGTGGSISKTWKKWVGL